MPAFTVALTPATVRGATAALVKIGFGEPGDNSDIVKDAAAAVALLADYHGELAIVTGPASLPAGFVIGHALAHRFAAVACYDPKMSAFVVALSHGSKLYAVGDVIPAADLS